MSGKRTILISVAILLISALITFALFMTEPEAQREAATKTTAMLVEVERVSRGDFIPTVVATGSVQAAKDIILSPQVGGEVIRISDNFIPGSFVRKGEVLLQINPADYRNTLLLRKSELELARSELSIEMGRQDVARKDYELIGQELSPENRALVLREPQLESARATVEAAEAAVNQAQLNLQRTTIRSPFDAHIISRNTNIGAQLAQGAEIGRIVGIEEYWVVANVPTGKVNWLTFSDGASRTGSEVKIFSNTWPAGHYREGRLFRLVGALDAQTRLARVLISIPDPLVRNPGMDSLPPLIIGAFVETHIKAREIQDVVRLNRDHLRQGGTVWVMQQNKLRIRKVEIAFQDPDYAYIRKGLSDNDQVVTTDLSTVVDGAELRTAEEGTLERERDLSAAKERNGGLRSGIPIPH
jgi:RND family efflux transporter MFP subunit